MFNHCFSKKFTKMFAIVGPQTEPMAIPSICTKYFSSYLKILFSKINFKIELKAVIFRWSLSSLFLAKSVIIFNANP